MSSFSGIRGKSVGPVDGLLSVSQGLAEGDSKVAGLCPSVFASVCCVSLCAPMRRV